MVSHRSPGSFGSVCYSASYFPPRRVMACGFGSPHDADPGLKQPFTCVLPERISMVMMLLVVVIVTEPRLFHRIGAVELPMIVPISFSGWGVREGVLVALLGTVSIPAQSALAFSLLFGACIAVSSPPGFAVWWFNSDRKAPGSDLQSNANILSKPERG